MAVFLPAFLTWDCLLVVGKHILLNMPSTENSWCIRPHICQAILASVVTVNYYYIRINAMLLESVKCPSIIFSCFARKKAKPNRKRFA